MSTATPSYFIDHFFRDSIQLEDFASGVGSQSAILFGEIIALSTFVFGTFFASFFQAFSSAFSFFSFSASFFVALSGAKFCSFGFTFAFFQRIHSEAIFFGDAVDSVVDSALQALHSTSALVVGALFTVFLDDGRFEHFDDFADILFEFVWDSLQSSAFKSFEDLAVLFGRLETAAGCTSFTCSFQTFLFTFLDSIVFVEACGGLILAFVIDVFGALTSFQSLSSKALFFFLDLLFDFSSAFSGIFSSSTFLVGFLGGDFLNNFVWDAVSDFFGEESCNGSLHRRNHFVISQMNVFAFAFLFSSAFSFFIL